MERFQCWLLVDPENRQLYSLQLVVQNTDHSGNASQAAAIKSTSKALHARCFGLGAVVRKGELEQLHVNLWCTKVSAVHN